MKHYLDTVSADYPDAVFYGERNEDHPYKLVSYFLYLGQSRVPVELIPRVKGKKLYFSRAALDAIVAKVSKEEKP